MSSRDFESDICDLFHYGGDKTDFAEDRSSDNDPLGRIFIDNDPLANLTSEEGSTTFDDIDGEFSENLTLDKTYCSVLDELTRNILNSLRQLKEQRVCTERRIKVLLETKNKPQPRKNWYHLFGSPYFKDKTFYPCSGNQDFYDKLEKNEINYHELPPVRRWKICDQQRVEDAVRNNLIEIKKKELQIAKDVIVKKLKVGFLTTSEEDDFNSELQSLEMEMEQIESKTTEDLLKSNTKQLDWLRISAVDFDGQRTSEELQAMWDFCLHPSISRKNWSHKENERLAEIAEKHNMEDWDEIASELNTNRSGFQCFVQYQQNLNKSLRKSKWTEEEDNNLRKIIQECRVGDFIPWSKVALQMKGRTKVQVYNRWTYSIDPMIRKGRFTPEEDCLIVAGVQRFGKDFPRISRFLPGRTSIQIRDRFIGNLQKVGPIGRWTKDEDKLLIELVKTLGTKSWSRIASHFSGRYRIQVRHRYLTLKKWMAKYPDLSLHYAPSRYLGDYCNRQSNLWSRVQNLLKSSLKSQDKKIDKKASREENILLLKKKLNMVNPKKSGRKAGSMKALTPNELNLVQCVRNRSNLGRGNKKCDYDECPQQKGKIIIFLLQSLNARLCFPFHEKLIAEDEKLEAVDKLVLIALKKVYDEEMKRADSDKNMISKKQKMSVEHSDKLQKTLSIKFGRVYNEEDIPLYLSDKEVEFQFPGYFPPSKFLVTGIFMLPNINRRLKVYQETPKEKLLALPSKRLNLDSGEMKVKGFSQEISLKLFKERLDVLFRWSWILKDSKPQIYEDVFVQNMKSSDKSTSVQKCHASITTCNTKRGSATKSKTATTTKIKSEKKNKVRDLQENSGNVKTNEDYKRKAQKENFNKKGNLKFGKLTTLPTRRSARLSKLQETNI